MIHKFGNPAVTLKVYLRKKWGWPADGLANQHISGPAHRTKQERRARWPLSRGARLKKLLPVHQKQIDGLIEDAMRLAAQRKAA